MANQYQRDLAERLLATLPSPTTPALKGAVRGIAYYDTGTARKTIKFLKQHVEDLRIGEEKAVQQYDGHKEPVVAIPQSEYAYCGNTYTRRTERLQ